MHKTPFHYKGSKVIPARDGISCQRPIHNLWLLRYVTFKICRCL